MNRKPVLYIIAILLAMNVLCYANGDWGMSAVILSDPALPNYEFRLNTEAEWTDGAWYQEDTPFTGYDFGTPGSLTLNGGEGDGWTDDSPGYTATSFILYYRAYLKDTTPGAWLQIPLDNLAYTCNLNRIYDKRNANIDLLSLVSYQPGTYTIEVAMSKNEYYAEGNWNTMIPGGQDVPYSSSTPGYKATFTIAALPVELTAFTAAVNGKTVCLKWNTATEQNNTGFDIERKNAADAAWTKIGFVAGSGTCSNPRSYSFTDNSALNGKYLYRLKQIDNDGKFKYSSQAEAAVNSMPQGFVIGQNYPNPFNPSTTIRFGFDKTTNASLTIYDQIGRQVATLFKGQAEAAKLYSVDFNASGLASGVYFYRLQSPERCEVRKMILAK